MMYPAHCNSSTSESVTSKRLIDLALPTTIGLVSYNILGLVDTAMVGQLGTLALAASGIGGILAWAFTSIMMGISVGVQAIAARRKGENDPEGALGGLTAGLFVGITLGVTLTLALFPLGAPLASLFSGTAEVQQMAAPYIEIRLLALAFAGVNFAFGAYWVTQGKSVYYMAVMLVTNGLNILLNYLLIFGHLGFPALGVAGAATATSLATFAGCIMHLLLAYRTMPHFSTLWQLPGLSALCTLLRLSLPASLHGLFNAASIAVTLWILGLIGAAEVAVTNVLLNLITLIMMPAMGLGTAAGTLVGEALGQRNSTLARQWGWLAIRIGLALSATLTLPMLLFPKGVLSVFIVEPDTLELALAPLKVTAIAVNITAMGVILNHALNGAGESRRVLNVGILVQWGVVIPAIFVTGPLLGGNLLTVWTVRQLGFSLLSTAAMTWIWQGEHWINSAHNKLSQPSENCL